ncbi:hypothetical protein CFIMG_008276RA00001 [Ceratocystis fimbriata CBS 114723]|uniref:Uncharacterized protein n=1 Tax=Ceratocystis fimbriata CBS 114723 TaxID=1035309 RepID=A0A2C5X548_9PEZI|nr:hypothetical protein CFIMG_008276RA00001 [Ceratocystis fimbriata CBS 114723]
MERSPKATFYFVAALAKYLQRSSGFKTDSRRQAQTPMTNGQFHLRISPSSAFLERHDFYRQHRTSPPPVTVSESSIGYVKYLSTGRINAKTPLDSGDVY